MTAVTVKRREQKTALMQSIMAATPAISEIEARLLAARGDTPERQNLSAILAQSMMDLSKGAARIAQAIQKREKIVVVADYDCDGATACAVSVMGMRALGADINYVVPDRMVHGYGISPSVVDLAREKEPTARVLITVDNGILGHTGITHAANLGLDVVVTDHHLPGDSLPADAVAVIDPSRNDCTSGLEKLAGVSVAMWLVVETKRELAKLGLQGGALNFLLPYVAIGTVADMVPLDHTNRQLVAMGMDMMRMGKAPAGVEALIKESGAAHMFLTTQDIGFGMGPRINAAGRLETMDAGIELLTSSCPKEAGRIAKLLTSTNDERKRLQKEATEEASHNVELDVAETSRSIVASNEAWHPGIIGLVASRLCNTHHLPTFVFAIVDGKVKGSGRSIKGFHLKDALEEVARRAPGVLLQFGGHAMAAGATLTGPEAIEAFTRVFEAVARDRITEDMLHNVLLSDGDVPAGMHRIAGKVLRHPWGQMFESPAFDQVGTVVDKKPLGKDGIHWRISAILEGNRQPTEIVLFNHSEPEVGASVHFYLQPSLNTWKGQTNLQWLGRIL